GPRRRWRWAPRPDRRCWLPSPSRGRVAAAGWGHRHAAGRSHQKFQRGIFVANVLCSRRCNMDHYGMELDPGPPRDFADLKTLVMARSGSLPRRLAQIASFALDNPDEIAFGTAASIATRAGVQPSTLVRLSQALGYQGFSDLQQVFRSRLKDRVLNYDERLKHLRAHAAAGSRAGGILEGFLSSAERSLAEARHTIEPEKLDDAVALLAGAETIYLVGLRRSFPIAAYMGYALGKLGVR